MQFLSQDKLVKTQNGQYKRKHYLNFSLTVDLFEVRVNKKKKINIMHSLQSRTHLELMLFQVQRKMENKRTKGIVIVPFFTAFARFTRLLNILVSDALTLPTSKIIIIPLQEENYSRNACHFYGNPSKTKEYQIKMQKCALNHGQKAEKYVTTTILPYGQQFVINERLITCNQQ